MEQRDAILLAIEKAGMVLAKLFNQLVVVEENEQAESPIDNFNNSIKDLLDIDTQELLQLENKELTEYLLSRKLSEPSIEKLGDALLIIAENETSPKGKEGYLLKAIELYNIANTVANQHTLVRIRKVENIKQLLNE